MPEGELHNIFQRHGKSWVLVGHASKRKANRKAAPWFRQPNRVADCAPCVCHSGGGSTLNREAVEPGAYPTENQLLMFFASFDNFLQHTPSSFGLAKPGGLQCDSAAATTSIVNTNTSATVREPNNNAPGFEFLLHNFGSGSVAANNSGFRGDKKTRLLNRVAKRIAASGAWLSRMERSPTCTWGQSSTQVVICTGW